MKQRFLTVLALVGFESSVMAATSDRFSCSLKVTDKLSNRESVQEFEFDSVRKLTNGLSLGGFDLYEGTTNLKNWLSIQNGQIGGDFRLNYSFAEKRDQDGKLVDARFRTCPHFSGLFCSSDQTCTASLVLNCKLSPNPFEDPSWGTPQISGERLALYGEAQFFRKMDIRGAQISTVGTASISCTWLGTVSDDNN